MQCSKRYPSNLTSYEDAVRDHRASRRRDEFEVQDFGDLPSLEVSDYARAQNEGPAYLPRFDKCTAALAKQDHPGCFLNRVFTRQPRRRQNMMPLTSLLSRR